MRVSISQPAYLPWLGYFDKIVQSDVHVVLDNVALERSSTTRFTNRNRVKSNSGPIWLTVPVVTSGFGQPLIKDVLIDNEQRWQNKHRRTIEQSYSKASHFAELQPFIELSYGQKWNELDHLLDGQRAWLLKKLGIKTDIMVNSEINTVGNKSDLILDICKTLGAATYLSGPFGRDYLELDRFAEEDISVEFHNYSHPTYRQIGSSGFEPFLSVLDLLANCGESSLDVLTSSPTC